MIKNNNDIKMHIPLKSLSGSKYLMSLINLFLVCVVIILFVISAIFYLLSPAKTISAITKPINIENSKGNLNNDMPVEIANNVEQIKSKEDYGVISARNIFSPERKEWITNATVKKVVNMGKKTNRKKKSKSKGPRKIMLYGIIIAGDIKKALINNPIRGAGRNRTLYVEEGDEVEGYKVKSIESDQIKLDWQGEEIVVKLYKG